MPSYTSTVLAEGTLSGVLSTLGGAVAAGSKFQITSATFCNSSGGVASLTVKLVKQTAGTARTVIDDIALADEQTYLAPELLNQILLAGGEVQGSGNGIEYYISGLLIVE